MHATSHEELAFANPSLPFRSAQLSRLQEAPRLPGNRIARMYGVYTMRFLCGVANLLKFAAAGIVGAGSLKLGEVYMEKCNSPRLAPRMAIDVYVHQMKEEPEDCCSRDKKLRQLAGEDHILL